MCVCLWWKKGGALPIDKLCVKVLLISKGEEERRKGGGRCVLIRMEERLELIVSLLLLLCWLSNEVKKECSAGVSVCVSVMRMREGKRCVVK